MSYLFLALALQILAPGLVLLVAYATGKLAVRALGVPGFRILRPVAPGTSWRAFGVRTASTLGAFLTCLLIGVVAEKQLGVELPTTTVNVLDQTPAHRAGLKDGDRIVAIDGQPQASWDALRADVRSSPNTRAITVERNGERHTLAVTPNENRIIGIEPVYEQRPIGTSEAFERAFALSFVPLRYFIQSWEKVELTGAVKIAKSVSEHAENRLGRFLFMGAIFASYAWLAIALFHGFDMLLQRFRRASG